MYPIPGVPLERNGAARRRRNPRMVSPGDETLCSMVRQEITEKLRNIIEPYARDQEALASMNEETSFVDDLDINSANLVDIIIDVEAAFDIEIDDDAAEEMLTVRQAVAIIESQIAKGVRTETA